MYFEIEFQDSLGSTAYAIDGSKIVKRLEKLIQSERLAESELVPLWGKVKIVNLEDDSREVRFTLRLKPLAHIVA